MNSVTPDANAVVPAENQFNDPPSEGRQFFIVNVTATYVGDEEPSSLFGGTNIKAVGPFNVAYQGFEDFCGVVPDELDEFADLFVGGSISGNLCWSVRISDVPQMRMYVEEFFSFEDDNTRWWNLAP